MSKPGCGGCAKVRQYLPAAIRQRLEEVERRMKTTPGMSASFEYHAAKGQKGSGIGQQKDQPQ